jgi:hypothetical protein
MEIKIESQFEKMFPEKEDQIAVLLSSGISLAIQLSAYRSAWHKNWGAAIWKTLIAQEVNHQLRRVVQKRAEDVKYGYDLTPKPFAWYN